MNSEKKLKAYSAMAETTRKWVNIMDAKAAFVSTLNAGLLTFIWTGAKLSGDPGVSYYCALAATAASFLSLLAALKVVLPKFSLKSDRYLKYKDTFKPVSYYGFVARNYTLNADKKFIADVEKMSEDDLAREALEQHFVTSHVAHYKALLLLTAGGLFFIAVGLTAAGLIVRKLGI